MRYFRVQVASKLPRLHGGRLNYQIKKKKKKTQKNPEDHENRAREKWHSE